MSSDYGEHQRINDILITHLLEVGLIVSSHIRFPSSFPYDLLGCHVVAVRIGDVLLGEDGITARVTVSIHALLDYPPTRDRGAGEDLSRRRTKVCEFNGTVELRATGLDVREFDDLTFVPPAVLVSWPEDL